MLLALNGNLDAMKHLFERYNVKIFNYCLKMTGDRQISQDITQEVFYKMIKSRRTFNNNKFSPWIYTIAKNLCYDHFKTKKNNEIVIDEHILNIPDEYQNERDDSDIKSLDKALNKLSVDERELIVLSKFQKLKYHEIGEILGATEGAIKTKIHRALKKLKQHYFEK